MSNIVLIGFMGVGKSAIGHKLAKELGMNFIDTDEIIEKTEKTSISKIFENKGEEYFRNLETEVLKTLEDYDNFVISTGGGMVLRKENAAMLKELGPVVLLTADPEVVFERVKAAKTRPLLNVTDPRKRIEEILNCRNPIYNSVADFTVDTSHSKVDEAVIKILGFVKEKK